jgi:hypothetical protein
MKSHSFAEQLDMKIIKQTVREVDSFGTKITGPHPDNFFVVLCLPAPDGQDAALDDGYSGDSSFGGGIGPVLLWLDLPHQYPDGPGGRAGPKNGLEGAPCSRMGPLQAAALADFGGAGGGHGPDNGQGN